MIVRVKRCDLCEGLVRVLPLDVSDDAERNGGTHDQMLSFYDSNGRSAKYDLCDKCANSFLNWLNKRPEEQESAKEPEKMIPEKGDIKLVPGTKTHHSWTKEEDDFILYHSAGLSVKQLAYKFGVTTKAVYSRKHMLLNEKNK